MTISLSRYYEFVTFEIGVIARSMKEVLGLFSLNPSELEFKAEYFHHGALEERLLSFADLGLVCSFEGSPADVRLGFFDGNKQWHHVIMGADQGLFSIRVSAPSPETSDKIYEILERGLSLTRVQKPPNIGEKISGIEIRLSELERQFFAAQNKLACFLSYRFSDKSKVYALELSRFLELAGVEVTSGAEYEPRRVSDKVRALLDKPMDFIVYLITSEGESMWTRDELGTAVAKGHTPVLLVEAGAKVESGILGDLEFLKFQPNHVSDCFIGIMEAIRFFRREKQSPSIQGDQLPYKPA
ncbi:MAG: hypothetical protein NTW38_10855 [Candidatus Aminicenantes bacterium]|nr:hypothetical protein [Candidatus Aminicenantes bacterium]